MITIPDRAIGGPLPEVGALAPYATPEPLLADALPLLDPPNRISVTDAAERYMRVPVAGVWQSYDRSTTPYMVEPQDTVRSRLYRSVAFVGPAQSGKTQALQAIAFHSVTCNPGPVQIVHMTATDRNEWVEEKLDPAILNSPDLRDRLGRGRDDSTFGRKRFKGMRLILGYPVTSQLSGRSLRDVLLTDYDHMRQNFGDKDSLEGSPYDKGLERTFTFGSSGIVFVESTPGFPIRDGEWTPSKAGPHEFAPVEAGIVPIYNSGTRARWYWECRDCGEEFEPRFDRLTFDAEADPVTAGDGAEMVCPHCGCAIEHRFKTEFNRAALRGRGGWRHEGAIVDGVAQLVEIGDPAIRQVNVASYALNGAAATFVGWSVLVQTFLAAQVEAKGGDERKLGNFHYTSLGVPYRPKRVEGDGELTVEALKADRAVTPRGTAPEWVRFVTVSVDVQNTWFPVQVTGWGVDGRRTVIDRFDLFTPPGGETSRKLDPAKYADDWQVLDYLEGESWEVEGSGFALQAVALAVDFQGRPGVSDNAEKHWKRRAQGGAGARWFVTRGHGGFHQSTRVWHAAPERASGGRRRRRGIKLLNMATDLMKDTVTAALTRPADVADAYLLPEWLEDDTVREFTAERRTEKGWRKRDGMERNESLDLSVQAQALAEHKGLKKINPEAPPWWAQLGGENPYCLRLDVEGGKPVADPEPAPPAAEAEPEPARSGGWLNLKKGRWL